MHPWHFNPNYLICSVLAMTRRVFSARNFNILTYNSRFSFTGLAEAKDLQELVRGTVTKLGRVDVLVLMVNDDDPSDFNQCRSDLDIRAIHMGHSSRLYILFYLLLPRLFISSYRIPWASEVSLHYSMVQLMRVVSNGFSTRRIQTSL